MKPLPFYGAHWLPRHKPISFQPFLAPGLCGVPRLAGRQGVLDAATTEAVATGRHHLRVLAVAHLARRVMPQCVAREGWVIMDQGR